MYERTIERRSKRTASHSWVNAILLVEFPACGQIYFILSINIYIYSWTFYREGKWTDKESARWLCTSYTNRTAVWVWVRAAYVQQLIVPHFKRKQNRWFWCGGVVELKIRHHSIVRCSYACMLAIFLCGFWPVLIFRTRSFAWSDCLLMLLFSIATVARFSVVSKNKYFSLHYHHLKSKTALRAHT